MYCTMLFTGTTSSSRSPTVSITGQTIIVMSIFPLVTCFGCMQCHLVHYHIQLTLRGCQVQFTWLLCSLLHCSVLFTGITNTSSSPIVSITGQMFIVMSIFPLVTYLFAVPSGTLPHTSNSELEGLSGPTTTVSPGK